MEGTVATDVFETNQISQIDQMFLEKILKLLTIVFSNHENIFLSFSFIKIKTQNKYK